MESKANAAWTIFLDEFLSLIKTKKALILIVSYLSLMFIGIKLGSLFEVFAWLFAGSRQSFSILLPFYVSVVLLPLFSMIISYNTISEEISQGSIKFMAYRVDRYSIISGKIFSSFALSSLMIFIGYLMALFYIHSRVGLWFFVPYLVCWVYLSIYSFCFICLTSMVSVVVKIPSLSIVWSLLALILFLFALNFDYAKFISPFYFSNDALDYVIKGLFLNMLLGFLILLLHGLLYFTIGYAVLKKLDLC